MRDFLVLILTILLIIILPISCKVYKYKECKKVGHATFYCIINKI